MQQLSGVNIGNCVGVRHLAYVYGISGVNTFFFGGGRNFFTSQGGGRSPRFEGPTAGAGFLARCQRAPPYSYGIWGAL